MSTENLYLRSSLVFSTSLSPPPRSTSQESGSTRRKLCDLSNRKEIWMRSFYAPEVLFGHHSAPLSLSWTLRTPSSTMWPSGGCSSSTSGVIDEKHVGKLGWNSSLSSTSFRKRSFGSPRQRTVRIQVAGGGWILPSLDSNMYQFRDQAVLSNEGPSCVFVGPLEKAEKARLEALYQQARDSYYSGSPLVVDDMFDKVEAKLRWHGSKLVLKYPRCSLKRFFAYADAEIDSGQMMTLAAIWSIILAIGVMAAAIPPACALHQSCQKFTHVRFDSHGTSVATQAMMAMNGALAIGMGLVVGIPVAVAAARSLQGVWRGDLVALKGCCPNCGEEVYAFVRTDLPKQPQNKTECHVCQHALEFRASVERSIEHPGRLWAYGRVYLLPQSKDLAPSKKPRLEERNEQR